jgi:hypothetical protein
VNEELRKAALPHPFSILYSSFSIQKALAYELSCLEPTTVVIELLLGQRVA